MVKDRKKLPVSVQDTGERFKKTNEAIGLRVSKGHLSFMSRKLFNVFVLHAQKLGAPGKNAPIESETADKYFWVPASDIQRDTHYNSNDTKLLKESLEELQDIRIISETDKEWTSERLLASVKIVNPAGLRKRGGRLWVGFEFPAEVMSLVMNPRTFTTLSLYYMTVLRTNAGLALYEAAKKHAWKQPDAKTDTLPWEEWRNYLEGMSGDDMPEWKHQYKFFNDRVLKKAVAEVNALTDIDVIPREKKDGKRVTHLYFEVFKKAQASLDLPAPPIIDGELIDRLQKLGLGKQEAEHIYSTHPEADIRAALGYTANRINDSKLPSISVPAAYFKNALRGDYASSTKRIATTRASTKVKSVELKLAADPELATRRLLVLEAFDAKGEQARAGLLKEFMAANPALAGSIRKNPNGKTVRSALAGWLIKQER